MDGMITTGTISIVRRVRVSREQLQKIAEILDIPADERSRLVSGIVYIDSAPEPARARSRRSSRASGTGGSASPRRK